MEFHLENLEQRIPAKKKENVCIFFCNDQEIDKEVAIEIVDMRKTGPPSDRKRILERLDFVDVTDELVSKAPSVATGVATSLATGVATGVAPSVATGVATGVATSLATETEVLKKIRMDKEESDESGETEEEEGEPKEPKEPKKKTIKIVPKTKPETTNAEPSKSINKTISTSVKIGKSILADRLPKPKPHVVRVSNYYMNNRKLFVEKLAQMFKPYRDEVLRKTDKVTCDSLREVKADFDLLNHQKVVRDYLNLFTPYRGILLYHSLGSGKSCSSIAIAEGMKSDKKIILMTPASLKMNYFGELKKCGDPLYRINQYWEFVSIEGKPTLLPTLEKVLNLPAEYIRERGGAWMVDVAKASNIGQLTSSDKESLNAQIDVMIRTKYYDINYNGMNRRKLREMTQNGQINPFDHSVVIIDEAHNLVSRIVNKLSDKRAISYQLYHYLMDATDVRIVLVSGTPIINYPNEVGVLFNILRGYIKTWTFNIQTTSSKKVTRDFLLELFRMNGLSTVDYLEYSGNVLTITRNPYGFVNVYSGTGVGTDKGTDKGIGDKGTGDKGIHTSKRGGKTKREHNTTNKKTRKNRNSESKSNSGYFINKEGLLVREPSESIKNMTDNLAEEETLEYHDKHFSDLHKGGANEFEDYRGMRLDETGNLSDEDFQRQVVRILAKEGIRVSVPEIAKLKRAAKDEADQKKEALEQTEKPDANSKTDEKQLVAVIPPNKYKCLPDDSKHFLETFINTSTGVMTNTDVFKRRILGLTSYYRSSQEQLMPRFVLTSGGEEYHKVIIEMSDFQFANYYKIRKDELDKDKSKKKNAANKNGAKGAMNDAISGTVSSTYRIFSRSACNFAFPSEHPRPLPDKENMTEDDINAVSIDLRKQADDYIDEGEDANQAEDDDDKKKQDEPTREYMQRIQDTLDALKYDPLHPRPHEFLTEEGLALYSPKFLQVLENLNDKTNEGLHMLYSQFRTVEGIGVFKLVLEAAGYAQFKIKKRGDTWEIDELPEDADKPKFVLYTGTETKEEKEVLLNIYNSTWQFIPPEMAAQLKEKHANNFRGEIIKLLMITSSGAEGINLRNTRFVHIMEPYWNGIRIEQVIGRARRICSHQDLPDEMRTVKVFMYLMTFTEQQRKDEKNIELMISDISRVDGKTPVTTDESLMEIAKIKQQVNSQILRAIKETAMDCQVYNSGKNAENLVCFGYGKVASNQFGTYPTLEMDRAERTEMNVEVKKWKAVEIEDPDTGIKYALNRQTNEVYDLDSYMAAAETGQMVLVGRLVKSGPGQFTIQFNR